MSIPGVPRPGQGIANVISQMTQAPQYGATPPKYANARGYNAFAHRDKLAKDYRGQGRAIGQANYNRFKRALGGTRSAGVLQAAPQAAKIEKDVVADMLGKFDLQRGLQGGAQNFEALMQGNRLALQKYLGDQRYMLGMKAIKASETGWQDVLGAMLGMGGTIGAGYLGGGLG